MSDNGAIIRRAERERLFALRNDRCARSPPEQDRSVGGRDHIKLIFSLFQGWLGGNRFSNKIGWLRAQAAEDCDSRLQPEHADHPLLSLDLSGMISGVDLF